MVPGLFVAGLFAVYFLRQAPDTDVSNELLISGPTMGTTFNVKVVTDDLTETHRERLTQIMREVVDGVDERDVHLSSRIRDRGFQRWRYRSLRCVSGAA